MSPATNRKSRPRVGWAILMLPFLAMGLLLVADMAQAQANKPPAEKPADLGKMTLLQRLRTQALENERQVRLADALLRWRYILALDPKNTEAAARVPVLLNQIRVLADSHYERGVALFRKKQREDALREFLMALTHNPDHAQALDYVRVRLKQPDWVYYTTVEGDTMKAVAKKAYQDDEKTFLVASYNDLKGTTAFKPGTVLKLPIIESDLRRPSVNVAEVLSKAKSMIEQGDTEQAANAAESILVYDPGNATARELMNSAYYKQGKELAAQNKPFEAVAAFKNVDPGYKDSKESINTLQASFKNAAEDRYKKGVEFFIKEALDEAIAEWEMTLKIDPSHAKAPQDLENAKQLRDRLRQVQR